MRIINIIVATILIVDGSFFGWPEVFRNPYFFPQIEKAKAATGVQHNWAWGIDKSTTAIMGVRGTEDGSVSIKVGSASGSMTDPNLRIQIVNTGTFVIGDTISLTVTDCTGVALKTCAGRSIGTNTTTSFVYLDDQDGTSTGIFRFRESASSAFIGGDQIPQVVTVADHNPTQGIMVEGTTSVASSTAAINSGSYPANDFSFTYYGAAPTVQKTYMFVQTYNGVLGTFSGMHGSIGATLDVLPANWTGSLIQDVGASITGNTTASSSIIFSDDSNDNSTTEFSYSLWETGTYTIPSGCSAIGEGAGHEDILDQDGMSVHKRTCDITGLTANKIYFFKTVQTDTDGIAGNATTVSGPFYMNVASGTVHMHFNEKDANDLTTDEVGDIANDDAAGATPVSTVTAADGDYTLVRTTGRMQLDSSNTASPYASNFTVNGLELRYVWGMRNTPETAQKLYIGAAGTEPALCASDGTGGTNWNLLEVLPNAANGWIAERASTTVTGYTIPQLAAMDVCLSNTNTGGSEAADTVGFDTFAILPIFTPPTSGDGSPTTTTYAATFVSSTGAQLNANMNTQAISGKAYFEYGTTVSYGSYSSSTLGATGEFIWNTLANHIISDHHHHSRIIDLSPSTLYHYRSCLRAPPTATAVCGGDMTFTTGAADVSFTQNIYRWYTDSDALDVTNPWGNTDIAANTPITVLPYGNLAPTSTAELRLRMNFTLSGPDNMSAGAKQFKLQYKQGTDSTCTTGSWTDVGAQNSTAPWRFANSSVQSPNLVTTRLSPASDVMELYVTSTPSGLNPNSATTGQEIEYDFHIENNNATSTARYSFRAVESDGTVFDAYTNCPTLTTGPTMGTFMRHGNSLTDGLETGFYWTD